MAGNNKTTIRNMTCGFCSCLCDDLNFTVSDKQIVSVENACKKSSLKFARQWTPPAPCMVRGNASPLEEGIEVAAQAFVKAQRPLIWGLSSATTEAQRSAVAIADVTGAVIDTRTQTATGNFSLAVQQHGLVTCSLGEIKSRADLVVFWGCDPVTTHPRLLERISARLLERDSGDLEKQLVVVDSEKNATAQVSDKFIAVADGEQFLTIERFRRAIKGLDRLEEQDDRVKSLSQKLVAAQYSVIFVGSKLIDSEDGQQASESILKMVRELNETTRCSCLVLASEANTTSAEQVMTWQTGYPMGVDFSRGYPEFQPRQNRISNSDLTNSVDLALCVSESLDAKNNHAGPDVFSMVDRILLTDESSESQKDAFVSFGVAPFGMSVDGTGYRFDGVPLPLRSIIPSALPSREAILRKLEDAVKTAQQSASQM